MNESNQQMENIRSRRGEKTVSCKLRRGVQVVGTVFLKHLKLPKAWNCGRQIVIFQDNAKRKQKRKQETIILLRNEVLWCFKLPRLICKETSLSACLFVSLFFLSFFFIHFHGKQWAVSIFEWREPLFNLKEVWDVQHLVRKKKLTMIRLASKE